jgi:DNA replication protein DnaC
LDEIDAKISELGVGSLLALHSERRSDNEEIFGRIDKLKEEKIKVLKQNNFSETDFLPKVNCRICNDTGIDGDDYCICFKQSVAAKLYGETALYSVLEKENFETFNFELYSNKAAKGQKTPRKIIEKIYLDCIKYADNFGKKPVNLFFRGRTGVGKTFMINCIAADLLKKGAYIIYMTACDLVDLLRKSHLSDYAASIDYTFVDALYTCDLLIIDDLGTENTTDFAISELFNLLNKRLISERQIIISTNLTLEELDEKYSGRIISRIMGYFTPYEFAGEDIRTKIN